MTGAPRAASCPLMVSLSNHMIGQAVSAFAPLTPFDKLRVSGGEGGDWIAAFAAMTDKVCPAAMSF